jgi:hypothetical protein
VAGQRLPTQGELAYVRRYVEEAKRVLERRARDPVGFHQGIWEQVQATRKAYSWRDRAAEWDSYLETH